MTPHIDRLRFKQHHDGFALFDTGNSSDRSSVKLAPGGRNYVQELFDAADRQGGLKKGTYFRCARSFVTRPTIETDEKTHPRTFQPFSMPEWFNPDYARYGWERFVSIAAFLQRSSAPTDRSTSPSSPVASRPTFFTRASTSLTLVGMRSTTTLRTCSLCRCAYSVRWGLTSCGAM